MVSHDGSILQALVSPYSADEFLSNVFGREHLLVRGEADRFLSLFDWNRLNELVRCYRFGPPRMRLAFEGKTDASTFVRPHFLGWEVLVRKLHQNLDAGATLVIDAVEEVAPQVTKWSHSLEQSLHERIQVNLYASFRHSEGFGIHSDQHDVFVLQVIGAKDWQVFGPADPGDEDIARYRGQDGPPRGLAVPDVVWEGTLEAGDMLYLPRGWLHTACGRDVPSLHLTVGVRNRTGEDLLDWLISSVRKSPTFQAMLPRFSSSEERRKWGKKLKDELDSLLASPDLVDDYLGAYEQVREVFPAVNLPWSLRPEDLTADLALTAVVPPGAYEWENSTLVFTIGGDTFRIPRDLAGPARLLLSGTSHWVGEVRVAFPETDPKRIDLLISDLAAAGLISVKESTLRG